MLPGVVLQRRSRTSQMEGLPWPKMSNSSVNDRHSDKSSYIKRNLRETSHGKESKRRSKVSGIVLPPPVEEVRKVHFNLRMDPKILAPTRLPSTSSTKASPLRTTSSNSKTHTSPKKKLVKSAKAKHPPRPTSNLLKVVRPSKERLAKEQAKVATLIKQNATSKTLSQPKIVVTKDSSTKTAKTPKPRAEKRKAKVIPVASEEERVWHNLWDFAKCREKMLIQEGLYM